MSPTRLYREMAEQCSRFRLDFPLYGQVGTVARERIRARRSSNNSPGTATSAIWKIVLLEWQMTFAPIFMSLSWMLLSDQRETLLGRVKRRRKFPRLYARTNSASLTWFDVNLVHDVCPKDDCSG